MPKYNKTVWVNEETPLNADNLNNIEAGIESNESKIEANTSLLESLQTEFNEHKIDSVDKFNEIEDKIERSTIARVNSLPGADEDAYNLNKIYEHTSSLSYITKEVAQEEPIVTLGDNALPNPTHYASAAKVGDNIYIFGGVLEGNVYSDSILKYNISTKTFETLTTVLPSTRSRAAIVAVGTNIYLFGGDISTERPTSSILKFDTLTETITTLGVTLSETISQACAVAAGNEIFIFGGTKDINRFTNTYSTVYRFDTETESIITLSKSLPNAWYGLTGCRIGDYIYLIGGRYYYYSYPSSHSSMNNNSVYKFNVKTGTFDTLVDKFPQTGIFNSAVIEGKMYIFGERDSIYQLNPKSNEIKTLNAKLLTQRTGMCSEATDNTIYVFGGYYNKILQEYLQLDFGEKYSVKTLVTQDDLNSAHDDLVTKDELTDALNAYTTEGYVDSEINYQLNQRLPSKQDKLTAGTGISIVNNVISATNTGSTIEGSGVEIINITDLDTIPEEYQDFEKLQTCYLNDDGSIYHLSYVGDDTLYYENTDEHSYNYLYIEDDTWTITKEKSKELATTEYVDGKVVANPTNTATETLTKLTVAGTTYSLPQVGDGGVSLGEVYVEDETLVINTNTGVTAGTQVEANNGEDTTDTLTTIKVDGTNYALPQGGAGNVYIDGDTLYIGEGTGTNISGCSNECAAVVEKIILDPLQEGGEVLGFELSEEELKKINDPSTFVLKLDFTYMMGKPDTSITNLTGVKVYFDDSITLDYENSTSWNINFTCNNISYDTLHRGDVDIIGYYGNTEAVDPFVSGSGWINPSYRCIEITGGEDVENEELIDWLYNNALIVKTPLYLYTSKIMGISGIESSISSMNMFYGISDFSILSGSSNSGGLLIVMIIAMLDSNTNTYQGIGMLTGEPLLTESSLAKKQDKLTAGTGITISNNVISTTSSSNDTSGVTEDWVNQQIANQHQDLNDLFTLTNTSMFTLEHQHAHKVGPMIFVHITFTPIAAPSSTGMYEFGVLSVKPLHNHSFALAAINESTGNVINEGATLKTDGTIVLHLTKSNASSNYLFDLSFFFCEAN